MRARKYLISFVVGLVLCEVAGIVTDNMSLSECVFFSSFLVLMYFSYKRRKKSNGKKQNQA